MPERIADFKYKSPIPIRFSDMDAFGHVNNAVYLTYFEIARVNYWREVIHWDWEKTGIILGRSEITYLKPITIHDQIACYIRTTRIGNSSFDVVYILVKINGDKEEVCTTGKSVCIAYDYSAAKSVPIPADERRRMIEFDEPGLILNIS